jgi:hypothetical protein
VIAPRDVSTGGLEAWVPSTDPIELQSPTIGALKLRLIMQYRIVEKSPEQWGASTTAYYYTIDDNRGEIIAWHWHPNTGFPYPHLHMGSRATPRQVHTPTSRVSIEAVIRYLIDELGVAPLREHREDWREMLAEVEQAFIDNRTWHAHPNA